MKKTILMGLLTGFFIFGMEGMASALLINLDATLSSNEVQETFSAGTYNITVVGSNVDGALYDAWNAWGEVTGCDALGNCSKGWISKYTVDSALFDKEMHWDLGKYNTPELALANAIDSSFTLLSSAVVSFRISDTNYTDNIGGMSLDVRSITTPQTRAIPDSDSPAPVPEPGTMLLLATGLVGLAGARSRGKKK